MASVIRGNDNFDSGVDLSVSTTQGDVKTYAFLVKNGSGALGFGTTYSGSALVAGAVDAPNGYIYNTLVYGNSGVTQAGTWRCMGTGSGHYTQGSVFVRIS